MKLLVPALLCGLLAAGHCAAQSSSFDPATGELAIPCLYAADLGQEQDFLYQARLRRVADSQRFTLEQLRPAVYDTDCSGSYHLGTQLYADVVNVGDDSYHVRMRRSADGTFTLEAATLRGPAQTALWVARNGANTVFLAGTIHLLRAADYPLPRAFDAAYARSTALYFELDYSDPEQNGANLTPERIDALMRDPQGKLLSQVLTPVTYGLLRDYLAGTWNLALETMDHWAAQTFVNAWYRSHLREIHGVDADGVDRHLANRALADGKRVAGFETLASHYEILHALDEGREEQVVDGFLFSMLSGGDILGFEQLVREWRSGDTTALGGRVTAMRDTDYADYLLLHANRNNAWVPRIEALLRTPETEMVVVGASHMAGPDGLVRQLRQRGYRVERY